jgi:putative ABC transport system substrate-binding protein
MCWRGRIELLSDFGFSILDFRLGAKDMTKTSRTPFLWFRSDNRKSAIQNPKWVGIFAIALTFVFGGVEARAQQAGKIFRIGFLDGSTASGSAVLVDAFRQELNKLGWIEGNNIAIEYRFGENKGPERMPEVAADLVRLKVDLIVVTSTPVALAVKKATTTIPIVMASGLDPVAAGLVVSLARPGGNVTGLTSLATELNTKRLEILKDAVPKLSRVALLRPAGDGGGNRSIALNLQLKELRAAALSLKLKLEEIETETYTEGLESAFQTGNQKHVGAMMTISSPRFFAERKRIVALAGKYRLPAIYHQKGFVDEGGLMSYGVDYDDQYRRAAVYVDKILKGAKPADLPVQQATKFEFVINLKAAKQIGLTIPPEVLARANLIVK